MHWLNMIMVAFLYALVGSLVGVSYALFTGADMASFGDVVVYAGFAGPVVLMVIAAMRKLMRESEIPITRAIYHTLLIAFAAPVFLYGVQLIAAVADAPKVARSFEVLKFWSIPLVFVFAVMYGVWRVIQHEERRMHRASGSSGGSSGTPPSGSGNSGGQSITTQRTEASGSSCDPINALRIALAHVRH